MRSTNERACEQWNSSKSGDFAERDMTWFEKNGFNIGREAFVSEEELIKTVLHEMHRLKTSTLRGSGSAAQVSQETKEAFDYANKTFNLFE